MKKKIVVALATIVAIILLLFAICFILFGIASYKGLSISNGRVLITKNNSYMIFIDDSPIVMSNQSKKEKIFAGLTNGDEIMIIHDGIEESYPGGTGVYYCKKLSDGEYKDLPEQVLVSLIEMGHIDMPPATQEIKDFTSFALQSTSTPSGIMFPQRRIINSVEELNEYVKGFNNEFAEQCEKYNENYFEEKSLIVLILEEGSMSISHTVTDLRISDDGKCYIYIDRNIPESGDTAMAYWHIFIEPNAEMTNVIKNLTWYDIQIVFSPVNLGTDQLVKVEKDNRMLSLIIPNGWEYATYDTMEHKELSDLAYTFFIEFWPENHKDGSIMFVYDENFGVCGTELECTEILLGGHIGNMGIYNNESMWSFITFDHDFVILNVGANKWWNEYKTEAMEILNTLEYK
ncbi:MAG: hypothetical protein IKW45_01100 [Clostridia bacterium]|nr:hypothetical protein [Clostridia bacterium]